MNFGNNRSNSSPGYVYFQQDNSYNSNDTSDYLSFGNSPRHVSPNNYNFSPSHYSSPRFKQNYRFNMRQNYRHSEYSRSRSFNSSNDSFGSQENFRNRNRHRRKSDKQSFGYKNSFNDSERNMSAYLNHTFMEDPWRELEKQNEESEAKKESGGVKGESNEASQDAIDAKASSEDSSNSETDTESVSNSGAEDEERT